MKKTTTNLPFLNNLNTSVSVKCDDSTTFDDAVRDPKKKLPLSRTIQFISDRSNALHLCLLVPRTSMCQQYNQPRQDLPTCWKSKQFPTMTEGRKTALVVWVEGMSAESTSTNAEQRALYKENLCILHTECDQKGVDIFIFTDASIDQQIEDRCVYIKSIPLENYDDIDAFFNAQSFRGEANKDVKYGRIDMGKIMATSHILNKQHYDTVAMQDVGKVRSIVHLLKDDTLLKLTKQFGIIEGGGSFPENYTWITHKEATASWKWVLKALISFFKLRGDRMTNDTSLYSTLAVMLIRQHFIYNTLPTQKQILAGVIGTEKYMADRVEAISLPNLSLGGLFPCQYSFLNSERDLKVALKSMALTCDPFANLLTSETRFDASAVRRRTIALGLITSVMSQMRIQEDYKNQKKEETYYDGGPRPMEGAKIICSDELVENFVELE